jgi:hypothetical protein
MPQLVKGGKWVFGWVIVRLGGVVQIPPAAFTEYGFRPGEQVSFLRGSRRSKGFSIARREKLDGFRIPLEQRSIGEGMIGESGQGAIPPQAGLQPGNRLLAVRGSGLALGFVQRGPIYEEALNHPEIEAFEVV